MKAVSWILTGFFALVFAWSLTQVPLPGDVTAPLSVHVSARYETQSMAETGISHPILAVLSDYRSFDLFLLSLLAVGACLLRWECSQDPNIEMPFLPGIFSFITILMSLALLGLGLFSVMKGCRFLDYECWTLFAPPIRARVLGAAWALGLAMGAYVLSFLVRSKGKP